MPADGLTVREDLGAIGVLLLRHVAELLEEREVDVRLDVALRSRVAVPVPGAPEVGARLDHPEILHPGLAEARTDQEAAQAAADYRHVDVHVERIAAEARLDERIVQVVGELAGEMAVLVVAVGAKPLVALPPVAFA